MKKVLALALSLLMMQAFAFNSFADIAPGEVLKSNDTQTSEGKVIFSRPSFNHSVPWNFTKNKEMTAPAASKDEEPATVIEVKTTTTAFKYQNQTVTKTDLKTHKTTILHKGAEVYDLYISGNSVFVEMLNYDIYRYDKTGKLTGSFKAAATDTYYVSAGKTILFREGSGGIAVSMALENQTKLTALKTFSDPFLGEIEGRTFLIDNGMLYEITTGKLVKVGTMDNYTATKTDVFLVYGGNIVRVTNGKSSKILTSTVNISKVSVLGQTLYMLDANGTLKSSDLSGKALKVVKNYVTQINKVGNELTGYVLNESGGLYQFVDKEDEPKMASLDANLFVMEGKRIVFIDSFGKLHYKDHYQSADLWSVDLKMYAAKDVLSKKEDARFSQIFLSANQVHVLIEVPSGHRLVSYDLKGNLVNQVNEMTGAWVKDGKILSYSTASGFYELNLGNDTVKTLMNKASEGTWNYSTGGYDVAVSMNWSSDNHIVKVTEKATQKMILSDSEVRKVQLLDANNLLIVSDNLGTIAFNSTSGKLVTLESQVYDEGSPIFFIMEGTSKQLAYYNQEDHKLNHYDLSSGSLSLGKQFDVEDSLFYSNNELLTYVDLNGAVWFYDTITGESVETPIDMEEFTLPSFDLVGSKVYIYDEMILYGYFDLTTEELIYFQAE